MKGTTLKAGDTATLTGQFYGVNKNLDVDWDAPITLDGVKALFSEEDENERGAVAYYETADGEIYAELVA